MSPAGRSGNASVARASAATVPVTQTSTTGGRRQRCVLRARANGLAPLASTFAALRWDRCRCHPLGHPRRRRGQSIHCPGIGTSGSDSQIDRGRRMTVNATLRSCAR